MLELPKDATLLASSPKTRVEVWAYDSHVLCIQGESPTVCVCVRPERRQMFFSFTGALATRAVMSVMSKTGNQEY